MFLTAWIGQIIILTMGYMLPAYLSFKALRARDTRWVVVLLVFWITMTAFAILERLFEFLFGWFLPFYTEMKALFVVFLLLPDCRGALYCYHQFLHPFFLRNEAFIDQSLEDLRKTFTEFCLWSAQHGLRTFARMLEQYARMDPNDIYFVPPAGSAPAPPSPQQPLQQQPPPPQPPTNAYANGYDIRPTNDRIPEASPVTPTEIDNSTVYPTATSLGPAGQVPVATQWGFGLQQRRVPTSAAAAPNMAFRDERLPSYDEVIGQSFRSSSASGSAPSQPGSTRNWYQSLPSWPGLYSLASRLGQHQHAH